MHTSIGLAQRGHQFQGTSFEELISLIVSAGIGAGIPIPRFEFFAHNHGFEIGDAIEREDPVQMIDFVLH